LHGGVGKHCAWTGRQQSIVEFKAYLQGLYDAR
jgi:hypothetical protein